MVTDTDRRRHRHRDRYMQTDCMMGERVSGTGTGTACVCGGGVAVPIHACMPYSHTCLPTRITRTHAHARTHMHTHAHAHRHAHAHTHARPHHLSLHLSLGLVTPGSHGGYIGRSNVCHCRMCSLPTECVFLQDEWQCNVCHRTALRTSRHGHCIPLKFLARARACEGQP